ncbi:MAG TPA: TolC family protein, partial [Bdellovibrionota bacterium]|nr:TolC family protein [Bdellovibrionota bacterium]
MKLNTQVALTLLMALASARENNPELRKVEIAADSAGWGKLEALSEHLPHVRARGTHFLGARYSILGVNFNGTPIEFPTAFPQTELEVGASILLFDGLSSINKYRAALSESDAAELELDYARFRLEQGVLTRFNQALAAQDLEKVADQNIETLEQHHHLALASQRAGLSTNVDVLR